jgi:hypothetical protein
LRHVTVLRAHAFAKTLFQLVDWVFEVNLPQRRCLWQGTFATCPKRMAAAAIILENGFALTSCSVCRRRDLLRRRGNLPFSRRARRLRVFRFFLRRRGRTDGRCGCCLRLQG